MDETELFSRLGVALAIGLLVGLERGWRTRDEEDRQRAAGFRTFALSGLLGGVTALLSGELGGIFAGLAFLAFAGAFALFQWMEASAERNFSATSLVAGLLTFLLGGLAIIGNLYVAVAAAVAMTLLLALREQLHHWVASLTWKEISAGLTLLAMTFLALPILPNRFVDPWNALNPYQLWLMTVLVAGLSFAGYVAVKLLGGQNGILVTALAGGLASSTATTLALARLGRGKSKSTQLMSAGILAAGCMMMARVGGVTWFLNPSLFELVAAPLATSGGILAIAALALLFRSSRKDTHELTINNPLALSTALRLGAFIGLVMLAAGYLTSAFGPVSVLGLAVVSGIADTDAITLSMSSIHGTELVPTIAALAILLAVASNTISKSILATIFGGRRIGALVGSISVAALLAGAAVTRLVLA